MKLSTRGRYAMRILLSIARMQGKTGRIAKRRIAEEEGITADYIEQLVVPLRKAGLVESVRGVRGGFRLARDPASVSLLEVLEASEGDLGLVGCLSAGCNRSESCATRRVWEGASRTLRDYFSGITLADLLKEENEEGAWGDGAIR